MADNASVTPAGFAEAIASLIIDVTDDSGFGTVDDIFDVSETTGGALGSDVDETITFSLAVADGTTGFVDVYFDMAGSAVVPAPASLLVLRFGLLALRRVRESAEAQA